MGGYLGKVGNSGLRNPSAQAKCECSWNSRSDLVKEEIKTRQTGPALCKDPHLGMPNTETGEAARSCAKRFSKSEPFAAPPTPQSLQVMPEYLHCAPCKNTLGGDWTCPMNYTLFIIIEPSLFPSCFRIMGWSSS